MENKGILLLELADLGLSTSFLSPEDFDKFVDEVLPATRIDRLVEDLDIPAITQARKEMDLFRLLQGEGLVDDDPDDTAPLLRFFGTIHEEVRNYIEKSKERIE